MLKQSFRSNPLAVAVSLVIGSALLGGSVAAAMAEDTTTPVVSVASLPAAVPLVTANGVGVTSSQATGVTATDSSNSDDDDEDDDDLSSDGSLANPSIYGLPVSAGGTTSVQQSNNKALQACADVNGSGLGNAQAENVKNRIDMTIKIQPNIDNIYNGKMADAQAAATAAMQAAGVTPSSATAVTTGTTNDAAVKGCFSASTDVINLATLIPTIQGSWGTAIADALQAEVAKKVEAMQTSVIKRGCQIANQAIAGAIAPVQTYMKTAATVSKNISNSDDLLAGVVKGEVDQQFAAIDMAFNKSFADIGQKINDQEKTAQANATATNKAYADLYSVNPQLKAVYQQQQKVATTASSTATTNSPSVTTASQATANAAAQAANQAAADALAQANMQNNTPTTTSLPATVAPLSPVQPSGVTTATMTNPNVVTTNNPFGTTTDTSSN